MTLNKKIFNNIIPVPDKAIYKYTLYLTIFFLFSVFLGIYTTLTQPEETLRLFEKIFAEYADLGTLGPITLFLLIFFNNIITTFIMMLLGTIFAITPILFVWVNGFIFGIAMTIINAELGTSALVFGLLPHGMIEIPVALLAAGYGMWLGKKSYRALRHKEPLLKHIKEATSRYLQYILPLFFLAACIECFFTKFILEAIVGK